MAPHNYDSPRIKNIAEKRLLHKNDKGELQEDMFGMFKRVAEHLAATPEEHDIFYNLMSNNLFLPNSPCLVNAGLSDRSMQLSACYVLDVPDSIEDIYDRIKATALIHKSGGGTGFDFSAIRHNGSIVSSTKGVASGPVSFMKVFDASTEHIKQGGVRRGANMGVLRIDHPDIEEFITSKRDMTSLQNFNISVGITEKFFQAYIERKDYELIDPKTKEVVRTISARKVFDMLVDNAWYSGDPGILFIDRINDHNPLRGESNIICATNPCGEQPLSPFEACGLGSINLSELVVDDAKFDFNQLRRVAMDATLFLHRMITTSEYPIEEIKQKVLATCKIGLGHMGFADALIKMKIPYTSEDAIDFAEEVGQTILDAAVFTTHKIGSEEGTFPEFENYRITDHIKKALQREGIPESQFTPANSALTTIAPTGTISMIANCSSGIEPVFYLEQIEERADTILTHYHPIYEQWKAKYPTSQVPSYFQDLKDIDPSTHIAIQSTFQRYVCSGVSKTVNLPNDASKSQVAQIFLEAYHTGCKGVTVYRDGCKGMQVIRDAKGQKIIAKKEHVRPDDRPEALDGKTYEIKTGYGQMLVTINSYYDEPFEVICQLGKSGASEMAKAEAISRLASIMLRCKVDAELIIDQLDGIVGGNPIHSKYGMIYSIPDALAKIMRLHINKGGSGTIDIPSMMKCPDCGKGKAFLQAEGTCIKCISCGWKSCA